MVLSQLLQEAGKKIRAILLILSDKKNLSKSKSTRQDRQDTSAFPEERQKAQPFSEGQIVFSQSLLETVLN